MRCCRDGVGISRLTELDGFVSALVCLGSGSWTKAEERKNKYLGLFQSSEDEARMTVVMFIQLYQATFIANFSRTISHQEFTLSIGFPLVIVFTSTAICSWNVIVYSIHRSHLRHQLFSIICINPNQIFGSCSRSCINPDPSINVQLSCLYVLLYSTPLFGGVVASTLQTQMLPWPEPNNKTFQPHQMATLYV